jgi:hypothetical protein
MYAPNGQFIKHSYTFYQNGTFLVSDDSGNRFGWRGITGLPSGTTATSVKANTTASYVDYVTSSNGNVVSNVTVSFEVRHQFCQPAGLKIAIGGTADWGAGKSGNLAFTFSKPATLMGLHRAFFGNRSGVALGFDWSDSAAFQPLWTPDNSSLSWKVPSGKFVIDPYTVGTSTVGAATQMDEQKKSFVNISGLDWVWYCDGTNLGWRTSSDGSTWSSFVNTRACGGGSNFGVSMDSSHDMGYAWMDGSTGAFDERDGVANSDGTISSNHPEISVSTTGYGDVLPFFAMSSSSNEWVSISTFESGHYHLEIYKCTTSCGTSTNWSKQKDVDGGTASYAVSSEVFLLSTSAKVTVAYGLDGTVGATSFISTTDGGTTWSTAATSSRSCNFDASGGAVISDTVHYACRYSGGVDYLNFPVAGSITGEMTVDSSCSACNPSVSTDGISVVAVSYADQSSHVYHVVSLDYGSTFGSVLTDASAESSITDRSYTSSPSMSGGKSGGLWTAGSSSPFNVRFAFVSAVYAQVTASINGNYTVTSSTNQVAVDCINLGTSPCFGIQLTVEDTSNSTTQWVFLMQHNVDIKACVTSSPSLACSGTHLCTFTSFHSNRFAQDGFQIIFGGSSSYVLRLTNSSTSKTCSPSSGNLNNMKTWEVGVGIGYENSACALWQAGTSWTVSGYAPSGASLDTRNLAPFTCHTSQGIAYSGGNSLWSTTGASVGTTAEFCNLNTFTFAPGRTTAADFSYSLSQ